MTAGCVDLVAADLVLGGDSAPLGDDPGADRDAGGGDLRAADLPTAPEVKLTASETPKLQRQPVKLARPQPVKLQRQPVKLARPHPVKLARRGV